MMKYLMIILKHLLRSIDIKKDIQDRFKDKIGFCKPSDKCTFNTTEYFSLKTKAFFPMQ